MLQPTLAEKYPLVPFVLQQQREAVAEIMHGAAVKQSTLDRMQRSMEIIDQTVDATRAEKEALMVGVIVDAMLLVFCAGEKNYTEHYSPEASAVFNALTGTSGLTPEVKRISALIHIAVRCGEFEIAAAEINTGTFGLSPEEIHESLRREGDIRRAEDKHMLGYLEVPRLCQAYETAKEPYLQALAQLATAARPAPAHQRPPAPRKP